jgi:hypothetical protein
MRSVTGPAVPVAVLSLHAQQPPEFTAAVALLKAVAKTYAKGADTFRMEAISETTTDQDLRHEWRRVYQTAIKGPGNLYRIETRSAYGSMIQDSDGTNEWVYSIEGNIYVKHPVPEDWPRFSTLYFMGNSEAMAAWRMRMVLESNAAGYPEASMRPEEPFPSKGAAFGAMSSTPPATIHRGVITRTRPSGSIRPRWSFASR